MPKISPSRTVKDTSLTVSPGISTHRCSTASAAPAAPAAPAAAPAGPLRRYHVNCYGLPPEFVQIIRAEVRRYRQGVSLEDLDTVVRRLAQRLPFLIQ
jgi:hypothetical protein